MARQPTENPLHQRTQWPLAVLLLALLGGVFAFLVYREYELTLSRERESLKAHARMVDDNLSQQLAGANAALTNIRNDAAAQLKLGQTQEISLRLKALSDAMPGVRTMLVINAAGTVVAASRADLTGLDVGQRPYLRQPKTRPAPDTLYVSGPFTTLLNVYSINLVKVWTDDRGEFAGAVTATLDPEYFAVLLRSVLYAGGVRSTLTHGNGQMFMSMPLVDNPQGLGLPSADLFFTSHRETGASESLFTGVGSATGDQRLMALRSTQPAALHMDQPLVATVSRPVSAVLAPWRRLAELTALMYSLVTAAVVVVGRLVQLRRRALKALWTDRDRETREQSERLELALAGGDLGSWELDLETGIRVADARAQTMVGCGPDDPVDDISHWIARVYPDDLPLLQAEREAHQAMRTASFVVDYRVRHNAGHWVWIHSRGKITKRDAQGQTLRVAGTYLDVSERKAAEAQLKHSGELLARMSRVSRTGGWDEDLVTGRINWSPEMFRIRELDPLIEPNQAMVVHAFSPESKVLFEAARAAAIEAQTSWDMELQLTTGKGNLIWVRSQGEAIVQNGKTVALTGTLKNVTWRKQSQIDLKIANEKLERMALSDGLTGIGNRRLFDQTLQAEWLRGARAGKPLALLMIDIDHFKLYNDHYGHAGGDECLRRVAQLLAGCSRRAGDLVSRFGGEEFAILLPGGDLDSARTVAQTCLDAIRDSQIVHAASPLGSWLTVSIGIASAEVDASRPAQSLLERADAALYRAKHRGRARFETLGDGD